MERIKKINGDFQALFQAGEGLLCEHSTEPMNRYRQEAFERFLKLGGIPQKTEAYKYADLIPVFDRDYKVVLKYIRQEVDANHLFTCHVPNMNTNLLLTINGWFSSGNQLPEVPEGVIICSMREAGEKHRALLESYYNRQTQAGEGDGIIALNTTFAQDGVFVYIPDGVVMEKPLQVVNLLRANADLMAFQRNLVIVGKGAEATILVCDHTLSDYSFLLNNTTEVVVGEHAFLNYYQVQNQHLGTSQLNNIFVSQHQHSVFDGNIITLYGGFVRNNIYVALQEEGCECELHGMYLSDKTQIVDNFTVIDHQAPRCRSNEHFKGVMDDVALANFAGRIIVRPDAQQTEAFQANNNLLLTKTTQVNTKPQLVIDADDVKCTHGATVGQMDEDAMFYLRTRGIGEAEARLMLMFGFAHEVVGRIRLEALRNQIDDLVDKRLRGELTRCENCGVGCGKT